MTDAKLAQLLRDFADGLESRRFMTVGFLREAARRIDELAPTAPPESACPTCRGDCAWCDGKVVQPATGRPRTYCCDPCRKGAPKLAETLRSSS